MFHKHEGCKVTILNIYVDDIMVTRNELAEIRNLRDSLAKEFKIKNLRDLRCFLGIEVARLKKGSSYHKESML